MARRHLRGIWLGRRRYAEVYALQEELRRARLEDRIGDVVLFLEHEPVVTLGRGGRPGHLLVSEELLRERGVDLVQTDRGGDITAHGPGQLVAYPIVSLAPDRCDVRRYVGDLTETMRRVAASFGIASGPVPDRIGLWVNPEAPDSWDRLSEPGHIAKLGAIGVRISRWVTMHGFALNLTTELGLFDLIVPCGIRAHGVTSVELLTGHRPETNATARVAFRELAKVFDAEAGIVEDDSEANTEDLIVGLGSG